MRYRSLLVLSMAALTTSVSSAGPLQWAWSMTVASMDGSNTLFAVNQNNPAKGYTFRFDPSYSDDPGPIIQPTPTNPTFATIGATSFRYWYQDDYPFNWVPTDAPADPNAGKFKVTITGHELTSGESATQDFVGTLSYRYGDVAVIPEVSWDVARVVWQLGDYDYDVRMETNFNPRHSTLYVWNEWKMSLRGGDQPGGEVPGVPEPGTLILGGIALAGGVGAWLRRRKAA